MIFFWTHDTAKEKLHLVWLIHIVGLHIMNP